MSHCVESPVEELVERLEDQSLERVVHCVGIADGELRDGLDALCDAIEARGRLPIVVDGAQTGGGRGALYRALSTAASGRFGGVRVQQLLEYLTTALDLDRCAIETVERAELVVDAICRLVGGLVDSTPVVMVVVEPRGLRPLERRAFGALMRRFGPGLLSEVDSGIDGGDEVGFLWCGAELSAQFEDIVTDELDLREASEGAVRRFFADGDAVDRLVSATDGDPRAYRALASGNPAEVAQLTARRLDDLSEEARRFAQLLAVAGQSLEVGFVDRLAASKPVGLLRALEQSGVVERTASGGTVTLSVANPAVRTALCDGMSARQRRQCHRRLMDTGIEIGSEDRAFIARHALGAGADSIGVEYGLQAVRRRLRRGDWAVADELLAELRRIEGIDSESRAEILEASLRLTEARGDFRQAVSLAEQLRQLDGYPQSGRLEERIGVCLMKIGRLREAKERFEAAVEEHDDAGRVVDRMQARLQLARIAYRRGGDAEARRLCDQIWTQCQALDDDAGDIDRLRADCRNLLGKLELYAGQLDEAMEWFDQNASEPADEVRRRGEVNRAIIAIQRGRWDEAARGLRTALEDPLPGAIPRANCLLNLGIVFQRRGRYERALGYYREAAREAVRTGHRIAYEVACHNAATLYQDLGAFDIARDLVERLRTEIVQEGTDSGPFTGRWADVVETQILFDEGRRRRALQLWDSDSSGDEDDETLYDAETGFRCVAAELAGGDVDGANQRFERLRSRDGKEPTPQCRALVEYCEVALRSAGGDGMDAGDWRSVVDGLEAVGLYRHAIEARLVWLDGLEDRADGGDMERVLQRGVDQLRRRAECVPDRFVEGFFGIADHRKLLRLYRDHHHGGLPEALIERMEQGAEPATTARNDDAIDRSCPDYRRWRNRYAEIVGEDEKMLQVFRFVDRVAAGETTVLITGESGTGKELVAEAVHRQSERSSGPFVKVNCAAFVEELLLSELFGHKKGAFTGAVEDRKGHFECADGGTIFLDEIGDISPKTQVALLRVLQEGAFEPVGSTETRQVDVRVVAATNRNLDQMVRQGDFRLDLYYRLKGFVIEMPPLSERREDIPRLLRHFAEQFSTGRIVPEFDDDVVQFLSRYRWPGNVRELENFVRSVLLFADADRIGMDEVGQFRDFFSAEDIDVSLPDIATDFEMAVPADEGAADIGDDTEAALVEEVVENRQSLSKLKKRIELKCIERALCESNGNISEAARILQMKRPRVSQIVNGTPELLALKEELVG